MSVVRGMSLAAFGSAPTAMSSTHSGAIHVDLNDWGKCPAVSISSGGQMRRIGKGFRDISGAISASTSSGY